MEADWEVEIGEGAPVIDAAWDGFVDLRGRPELISSIAEAQAQPGLSAALLALNCPTSLVSTSKTDIWSTAAFDPDEFEADPGKATTAQICYVDMLLREERAQRSLDDCRSFWEGVCLWLKWHPLPACRVDFILRQACLAPDRVGFGATVYVAGCGATSAEAGESLTRALQLCVAAVEAQASPAADSHYNGFAGE